MADATAPFPLGSFSPPAVRTTASFEDAAVEQAPSPTLRIGNDLEDKPARRRTVVVCCLFGAIAIHGALAALPLRFGGSAVQYGISTGDQIEVTVMVEDEDSSTPIVLQSELLPPPAPPVLIEAAPEFDGAVAEEPLPTAQQVAPPVRLVERQRATAPAAAAVAPRAAKSAGVGQRAVAKPNYLRNPPPKYPAESRKLREEGVVLVKVSVTPQGRPAAVQLQRSSGFPRLDDAALKAVRRWEFSPATDGLRPVAAEVEVPVRFDLK